MAKLPDIQKLQKEIHNQKEIISEKDEEILLLKNALSEKIKALEYNRLGGFSVEEKRKLSFFENFSDNIAIWASRGDGDNYEIVFWNSGAENIYGYSASEALQKNFLDLFISEKDKKDAQSDCDKIILLGTSYKNNIATDLNRKKKPITVITNTFRIEDFEREGAYLQAELGLDVSDQPLFTGFRSLEQLHAKFELQKNLISSVDDIDKTALIDRPDHFNLFSKHVINCAEKIFGPDHTYFFNWNADQKLKIEQAIIANKEIDEELNSKISAYKDEIHVRMKPKTPACRLTLAKQKNAFCPIFSNTNQKMLLGFFLMEFADDLEIEPDLESAINLFISQVHFALLFMVLNTIHQECP